MRKVKKSSGPNVIMSDVPVSEEMLRGYDGVQHSDFLAHYLPQEDPFKVVPKRKDHDAH